MWWSGTPCVDRSSLACGFQTSDVTCELVTRLFRRADCVLFQKWIVLSDEPPPEARRDEFQGHQARACEMNQVSRRSDGENVERSP